MSIRIINGTAYMSETASWWRVKAHDLGNGHLEVAASRPQVWKELDWTPQMVQDHMEMVRDAWKDAPEELEAERREKMLRIAANRAKTRVRKLCKAMGVDTLLTLTYRTNEQDLQRCKADLKAFNRKMLRVMPGFGFVAAFEHQERGALHVHMATRGIPKTFELVNSTGQKYRVKSYNVIRAIWRSVTKEREGNIDVQRRKRAGDKRPAAIARYIAGYIIKEFAEGEKHSNRWTKYGECTLPPPVQLGTVLTAQEAIEVAFALLNERHTVDMSVYSKWGDWFFLSGEGG